MSEMHFGVAVPAPIPRSFAAAVDAMPMLPYADSSRHAKAMHIALRDQIESIRLIFSVEALDIDPHGRLSKQIDVRIGRVVHALAGFHAVIQGVLAMRSACNLPEEHGDGAGCCNGAAL